MSEGITNKKESYLETWKSHLEEQPWFGMLLYKTAYRRWSCNPGEQLFFLSRTIFFFTSAFLKNVVNLYLLFAGDLFIHPNPHVDLSNIVFMRFRHNLCEGPAGLDIFKISLIFMPVDWKNWKSIGWQDRQETQKTRNSWLFWCWLSFFMFDCFSLFMKLWEMTKGCHYFLVHIGSSW